MNKRLRFYILLFCIGLVISQIYTVFSVTVANFIIVVIVLIISNLLSLFFFGKILNKKNIELKYMDITYRLQTIDLKIAKEQLKYANGPKHYVNDQFTKEEIRTLVTLCHPDKHGQKKSAVTMTQKLNNMRR